ncbi:hypothetical protein [Psychroflexus planctonicus]|uniref:Lipoprotein n=1 Tax=Psychroflexus planctonicus TaxID=1526575 RepID=A0ABQ1SCX0_9FLAO|nr:hypothetical protein [Psychroflexus planctonicus]GGE29379.1 hypothetical protein GCM10010832_07370 [Psychroflexus planctonicus]
MKKLLLIFILTLSCSIFSYSQTSDSIKDTKVTKIRINCSNEAERNPLYVIKIKGKTTQDRPKSKNFEESFLKEIQPKWIESTKVLRASEGLEEYGSLAKDGVILVILKNDSWEKMSLELQNRFE